MVLLLQYLSSRRGGQDDLDNLVRLLAPSALSEDGKHTLDIEVSVAAADSIGLIAREGTIVKATDATRSAVKAGHRDLVRHIRTVVLLGENNTADWGSQAGARDLTNGLAWLLTIPEGRAPSRMETGAHSVKELEEADFGPRTGGGADDASNWPIVNETRWGSFRRWACSLGFAWVDVLGRVIPDPTPVIRDELATVLPARGEMEVHTFIDELALRVPVLDKGVYREHVLDHFVAPVDQGGRLTDALSMALRRLEQEGKITTADRGDAEKIALFDGSTVSHVSKGAHR